MKLTEKICEVLRTQNAKEAIKVADAMRFGALKLNGQPVLFNYNDMIDFVAKATGRPKEEVGPEWEALLAEGDVGEE